MPSDRLVEWVPNFSEGQNPRVIQQIIEAIQFVPNTYVLHRDTGKAAHRTVITLVSSPESIVEAAFQGIAKATELINMLNHKGAHPRFGATDVCPLIPLQGVSMDEVVALSYELGERVGRELGIPVYLYERSASDEHRRNLANVRKGEFEGLMEKLQHDHWLPDYGPRQPHAGAGAVAVGARPILVAFNMNLDTPNTRIAREIAAGVRESGRVIKNEHGKTQRQPGQLEAVKAIGWYIDDFETAQVSMNLTNIQKTPVHIVFDAVRKVASQKGLAITGSELIGMIPKRALIDAGCYFLDQQQRSDEEVSEQELVQMAIDKLGLNDLAPFDPQERVIEYKLEEVS